MSNDKVVPFKLVINNDNDNDDAELKFKDSNKILEAALGELSEVLLIGRTNSNDAYVASSTPDKAKLIYMVEQFKHHLLDGLYDGE